MNVIDKILNEWSFRCHDGIVDINDPKKTAVLKEILIEEGIEDDIVDAILNLPKDDPSSEEKKRKVLNYLTGGDDEKDKEIEKLKQQVGGSKQEKQSIIQKLKDKNIPEKVSRFIVFEASENEELESLNQLINSLDKLEKEGSLKEKVGNLTWINDIVSGQSSLGIGKGEVLLAIMLNGGKLSEQTYGDVEFKGEDIEIKQSSKSDKGTYFGAIISNLGRSDDYKIMWNLPLPDGQNFKTKYGFESQLSTWTPIWKKYKEISDKKSYIKDLTTIMDEVGFTDVNSITDADFKGDASNFYKKIAYCSVGDYLEDKSLILMNSNLDYVYLNEEEYKNAILTNSQIYANNAFSPRISYKEKSEDESEKAIKPKRKDIVQQNVKKKEEEIEKEISQEKTAQDLLQKIEVAKQKLEDYKSKNPKKEGGILKKTLDDLNKEYTNYVTKRKMELSRVREEFTNSVLEVFTEE